MGLMDPDPGDPKTSATLVGIYGTYPPGTGTIVVLFSFENEELEIRNALPSCIIIGGVPDPNPDL